MTIDPEQLLLMRRQFSRGTLKQERTKHISTPVDSSPFFFVAPWMIASFQLAGFLFFTSALP